MADENNQQQNQQNEPTAGETPPAQTDQQPQAGPDDDAGKGGKTAILADLAKERDARQALQAQLDEIKRQQMTDVERQIDEAKANTRLEVAREFGQQLAAAKIEAALTGVVPDPSAVIGDLNLAKYVDEKGTVDAEAVAGLRERWTAIVGPEKRFQGSADAGARGGQQPPTLDEQIAEAEKAGDIATSMRLKAQKLAMQKQ